MEIITYAFEFKLARCLIKRVSTKGLELGYDPIILRHVKDLVKSKD